MTNPTLLDIKNELVVTKAAARAEWVGSPSFAAGHQLRKAEAKQALPKLEKTFASLFAKAGFPVFTDRFSTPLLKACLDEDVEAMAINIEAPFSELYKEIRQSIGSSGVFGPHQFGILTRFVRDVATKLEIASLPSVTFADSVFLKTDRDLHDTANRYLIEYGGELLLPLALQTQATELALSELPCTTPVIPVFFYGSSAESAARLGPKMFQKKFVWTPTPDKVDKKFVLEVLNNIKKTIKSKE